MSRYSIDLSPAAKREFKKLPSKAQEQVSAVIDKLAENPRPHGYKPLHGKLKGFFRIDTGDYRIIYEVHDNILLVFIIKVGDRRDVYR